MVWRILEVALRGRGGRDGSVYTDYVDCGKCTRFMFAINIVRGVNHVLSIVFESLSFLAVFAVLICKSSPM